MAGNKTKPGVADVESFLASVTPPARQADARIVCRLIQRLTGQPPVLWGSGIVGFGRYRYRYDSGREGEAPRIGFSPRSTALVLYLSEGLAAGGDLLSRLGKHKAGKGCIYINKLADVDLAVLEALIGASLAELATRYPEA